MLINPKAGDKCLSLHMLTHTYTYLHNTLIHHTCLMCSDDYIHVCIHYKECTLWKCTLCECTCWPSRATTHNSKSNFWFLGDWLKRTLHLITRGPSFGHTWFSPTKPSYDSSVHTQTSPQINDVHIFTPNCILTTESLLSLQQFTHVLAAVRVCTLVSLAS